MRRRKRFGVRTGSSRASTIPTSTKTTHKPRRSSKKLMKPTAVLSDPRRGPATTASATLPSTGRKAAAVSAGSTRPAVLKASGTFSTFSICLQVAPPASVRRGPVRGRDIEMEITIDFEEAVFGVEKTYEVPRIETCSHCHGNKAEPGTPIRTCPECDGTGQVRRVRQTAFGQFVTAAMCGRCHGEGKFAETPCTRCHGAGRTEERRRITVRIPEGIDTGYRIRLRGEGEAGLRGGPPGDLYFLVRVRPHKLFKRDGADVILEQPIQFVQAALGDEIEVPTLEGTHKLNIPEGTQHGTEFRLRGQGIPRVGGFGRGDQIVRVKVEVPRRLTVEQKELLKKFAEAGGDEAPSGGRSFFDRVRDTFSGGRQAQS